MNWPWSDTCWHHFGEYTDAGEYRILRGGPYRAGQRWAEVKKTAHCQHEDCREKDVQWVPLGDPDEPAEETLAEYLQGEAE